MAKARLWHVLLVLTAHLDSEEGYIKIVNLFRDKIRPLIKVISLISLLIKLLTEHIIYRLVLLVTLT